VSQNQTEPAPQGTVFAELKETTSFTIEPSVIEKLDSIAREDGTSRSALIRWILTTFVDNYK
jgi:metal-responsive CopG/Arc/MetJ family transcriptional regulator